MKRLHNGNRPSFKTKVTDIKSKLYKPILNSVNISRIASLLQIISNKLDSEKSVLIYLLKFAKDSPIAFKFSFVVSEILIPGIGL